jgi:hypothetical protein
LGSTAALDGRAAREVTPPALIGSAAVTEGTATQAVGAGAGAAMMGRAERTLPTKGKATAGAPDTTAIRAVAGMKSLFIMAAVEYIGRDRRSGGRSERKKMRR